MAMKTSRLTKAVLAAVLGLSLSGGGLTTTYASDADAELAALELELATLEAELAQEKGTIKEEKTKLAKEPNKMKLSGDARVKYAYAGNGARWYYRGRLAVQHDINEKVSVNVRWGLMNDNPMGLSEHFNHKINTFSSKNFQQGYVPANIIYPDMDATDGSWVSDANIQFKKFLGADKVTLGRFGQTFGATGLMGDEDAFGGIDGIKFDWSGPAGSLTVGYAKFGALQKYPKINTTQALNAGLKYIPTEYTRKPLEQAFFVNAKANLGPAVTLHGLWIKEMNNGKTQMIQTGTPYTPYFFDNPNDHDYRGIGLTAKITPNLTLTGDWIINMSEHTDYLADGATSGKDSWRKYGDSTPTSALNKSALTHYKKYNYKRQVSEYVSLRYKEAKWGDKGSFGIHLDWRNIDPTANLDGYFTMVSNIGSNKNANVVSNNYYISRSAMYNTLSVADDILAFEGIRGPVIGFDYMITKNVKLSVLQSFAGTVNGYRFNHSITNIDPSTKKVEKSKDDATKKYYDSSNYRLDASIDQISERADNMTVIAITAKF